MSVFKNTLYATTILAALAPSAALAETVDISVPKSVISAAFNVALSSTSVKLDNYGPKNGTSWHKDSSYVLLPGGSKKPFSIREQTFNVTKWRKLRHYIDDMRTSNIQASVNGDRIDVSVFFESQGEEVKGKCIRRRLGNWKECNLRLERDIHLNNAQILVSLTPVAYDGTISFANAKASFKTDIKIANKLCKAFSGICGWIEGKIKNQLTSQIEGPFNSQLNSSKVRTAVANSIKNNAAYKAIIDPSWKVTKVASSGSNFIVTVTRPDAKPYSVDLRVTQQGVSCPKRVEVRAFIKYRRPATAKFRFKVNGELSELVEIKARKLNRSQSTVGETYLVERVKYYDLDPGQTNFRIEVRGGEKSDVKTVRITCPRFEVTRATLEYKLHPNPTCSRQVWETAKFYTNRPGNVRYAIKREPGKHTTILLNRAGTVKSTRRGNEYYAVVLNSWKNGPIDTRMKAYATGTPVGSKWTQFKVDCN